MEQIGEHLNPIGSPSPPPPPLPQSLAKGKIEPLMVHVVSHLIGGERFFKLFGTYWNILFLKWNIFIIN
jgi:hypothetical protein